MCILVVAVGCHPRFPFVAAHNRDEKRLRPTGAVQQEADTNIICARDQQAGGMVTGLQAVKGHWAALTNVRTEHAKDADVKTSRGLLVEHLVTNGPASADSYLEEHEVDGYHIVFGNLFCDDPQLRYAWCSPETDQAGKLLTWKTGTETVGRGVFVISNENKTVTSSWPKCDWLRERVAAFFKALPVSPSPSVEDVQSGIAEIMGCYDVPEIEPPPVLPARHKPEREKMLHGGPFSPWRQEFPEWGTVSQSIVVTDIFASEVVYFHRSTNLPSDSGEGVPCRFGEWAGIRTPMAVHRSNKRKREEAEDTMSAP